MGLACRLIQIPRPTAYYRSRKKTWNELRIRMRDLAAVRIRYGYRRLHVLLHREGWKVNHKLVWRIYREEGLSIRTKGRKKKISRLRVVLPEAKAPNECWSMDFVSDGLFTSRRFRVFTLVDHFTRESPAIVVDQSILGSKGFEVLDHLAGSGIKPKVITVDYAFSTGLPGRIKSNFTPLRCAHSSKARPENSGPLSTVMTWGLIPSPARRSRTSKILPPRIE